MNGQCSICSRVFTPEEIATFEEMNIRGSGGSRYFRDGQLVHFIRHTESPPTEEVKAMPEELTAEISAALHEIKNEIKETPEQIEEPLVATFGDVWKENQ